MNIPRYSHLSHAIKMGLGIMFAAQSTFVLANTICQNSSAAEQPTSAAQVIQKMIQSQQTEQSQAAQPRGKQRAYARPEVKGLDEAFIPVGAQFDPFLGFTIKDSNGKDVTAQTKILGGVDTSKPGVYRLNYLPKGEGFEQDYLISRAVVVLEPGNTPPEINVPYPDTAYLGSSFDPLPELPNGHVSAFDFEDGNLIKKVEFVGNVDTSKVGIYPVEYQVTDSGGLTAVAESYVQVRDKRDTMISLRGVSDSTSLLGDNFDPLHAVKAIDENDGDITHLITVSGAIDTSVGGNQYLTYSITNSEGVTNMRLRRIYVHNNAPLIEGLEALELAQGMAFDPMAGVTVTDTQDGDLVDRLTVTGSVDTNTPGVYTLTYTVEDNNGSTTSVLRNIVVRNPAATQPHLPEFNGIKDSNERPTDIGVGSTFDPMEGVTATDAEDGDVTQNIIVMGSIDTNLLLSTQHLLYLVTDRDNYAASKVRLIGVTNQAPVISGAKESEIRLTVGDSFDPMAGITAQDREDGDITRNIKLKGTVDTSKAGFYQLSYTVTDSHGAEGRAFQSVQVVTVNTPPVLQGVGPLSVEQGSHFDPRKGVTAFDKEDGNLSYNVQIAGSVNTRVPGSYTLTYSVRDRQGEQVTVARTVTVTEKGDSNNTLPEIRGVGPATISQGASFDPRTGVSAIDKEDGNLSHSLRITGRVNSHVPGTYTLTYSVTDRDGGTTTVKRTVRVTEKGDNGNNGNTLPEISGVGPVTINQGEYFDTRAGVSATDKEDGNLTYRLLIAGRVNSMVPGTYTLTYSITDRNGGKASAQRIVTVKERGNTLPVISGVEPITINVNDVPFFDSRRGVTVMDKEDGNIFYNLRVSSRILHVPGAYTLTYSVTDRDGGTTTVERTVTVI